MTSRYECLRPVQFLHVSFCNKKNVFSFRSEYGAFWKCIQASGIYVFTQLCKMLVLATFFPDTSASSTDDINLFSVSEKMCSVNCAT